MGWSEHSSDITEGGTACGVGKKVKKTAAGRSEKQTSDTPTTFSNRIDLIVKSSVLNVRIAQYSGLPS